MFNNPSPTAVPSANLITLPSMAKYLGLFILRFSHISCRVKHSAYRILNNAPLAVPLKYSRVYCTTFSHFSGCRSVMLLRRPQVLAPYSIITAGTSNALRIAFCAVGSDTRQCPLPLPPAPRNPGRSSSAAGCRNGKRKPGAGAERIPKRLPQPGKSLQERKESSICFKNV